MQVKSHVMINVNNFSLSSLKEDEELVLEFSGTKLVNFPRSSLPVIHDSILSGQIHRHAGIFVPSYLSAEFEGRELIPIQDPKFFAAFKHAYPSFTKHPSMYKWKVVQIAASVNPSS